MRSGRRAGRHVLRVVVAPPPAHGRVPRVALAVLVALGVGVPAIAHAERAAPLASRGLELAALAPPPADDARKAVALGPTGQVFAPDGAGGWVRDQAITTADRISLVGRAGGQVVALGDGVVFRLAPNGWTAVRIIMKGKATISAGPRSVAVIGRQLFAIDRAAAGEPTKLALAPSPVLAIGSGKTTVIALERGLFRVEGAKLTALKRVPRRVDRLVSDRWALVAGGTVDLSSGKTIPWPSGVTIVTAASGPTDGLVAVATVASGSSRVLELVTVTGTKLVRDRLPAGITGSAVGVALDTSGRAVIALRDGRLAVRERGAWTVVSVREALPAPHPGAPPATSP